MNTGFSDKNMPPLGDWRVAKRQDQNRSVLDDTLIGRSLGVGYREIRLQVGLGIDRLDASSLEDIKERPDSHIFDITLAQKGDDSPKGRC